MHVPSSEKMRTRAFGLTEAGAPIRYPRRGRSNERRDAINAQMGFRR